MYRDRGDLECAHTQLTSSRGDQHDHVAINLAAARQMGIKLYDDRVPNSFVELLGMMLKEQTALGSDSSEVFDRVVSVQLLRMTGSNTEEDSHRLVDHIDHECWPQGGKSCAGGDLGARGQMCRWLWQGR
jgi:hypothetical protein